MEPTRENPTEGNPRKYEREWTDAGWKHPYVLYIGATALLFGFLILMGYLALENDWIPKR